MLGRTHELGGVVALLATDTAYGGIHTNSPTALACLLVSIIGALTPDLDKPTSIIYKKIPAGSLIGHIINPIFIGGHRHISHSILGFAAFTYLSHKLLFLLPQLPGLQLQLIWYAYLIGIASHFILDAMTTEGIPLFFPFGFKFGIPPIKALRIKTGGIIEFVIVLPLLILAIGFYFYHYYAIFAR